MVVVIYTGERWEVSQGRHLRHKGTAAYLKNIGAKIVPNSAEVIDARDVDEQGRLRLPAEERDARWGHCSFVFYAIPQDKLMREVAPTYRRMSGAGYSF